MSQLDDTILKFTAFYDIFDGYFHVHLKLNISVEKYYGLAQKYMKNLVKVNNNTAPCFIDP
jgi:hypothetical protein